MNVLMPNSSFSPTQVDEMDQLEVVACWWGENLKEIPNMLELYMNKWGQFFAPVFKSRKLVDAAAAMMTYSDIFAHFLMDVDGIDEEYLNAQVKIIGRMFMSAVDVENLTVPGMVLQNPSEIRWNEDMSEQE